MFADMLKYYPFITLFEIRSQILNSLLLFHQVKYAEDRHFDIIDMYNVHVLDYYSIY